jgi:hypothetical protein
MNGFIELVKAHPTISGVTLVVLGMYFMGKLLRDYPVLAFFTGMAVSVVSLFLFKLI